MQFSLRIAVPSLLLLASCAGGGGGQSGDSPIPTSSATILSTVPAAGEVGVDPAAVIHVHFSQEMDPSTLSPASFLLSRVGSAPNQVAGSVSYDAAARTAEFTPSGPLASNATYEVRLETSIRDLLGAAFQGSSFTFSVRDATPPSIVHVSPACGTRFIVAETVICVEFSEAMDAASLLDSRNVHLQQIVRHVVDIDGNATEVRRRIASTVTPIADGRAVCVAPDEPLDLNERVELTVTTGVRDLSGHALSSPLLCSLSVVEGNRPVVVSTSPADGAIDQPFRPVISATFSEPLQPIFIDSGTIRIEPPVPGTVSYDAATRTITFTLADKLELLTDYTVTLSGSVQDIAGNALGADYRWSFRTFRGWQTPGVVDAASKTVTDLVLESDHSTGRSFAAWLQQGDLDAAINVYAAIDEPGLGWQAPQRLSPDLAGNDAETPRIAVHDRGKTYVVWSQKGALDAVKNIYSISWSSLGGWDPPSLVSPDDPLGSAAANPAIAVDQSTGVPYVLWAQERSGDTKRNTYISSFDPSPPSWSVPVRLSDDTNTLPSSLTTTSLAVSATGDLHAAWLARIGAGGDINVFANNSVGGTWLGQVQVSNSVAGRDCREISIAASHLRPHASLIWIQRDSGERFENLQGAVFSPATGVWGAPSRGSDDLAHVEQPDSQMHPWTGDLLVVWRTRTKLPADFSINAYSNTLTSEGWLSQARISDDSGDCTAPSVCVDPVTGDAFAAWVEKAARGENPDDFKNVYASQRAAGFTTWDPKILVGDDLSDCDRPSVRAFSFGRFLSTIAVWQQEQADSLEVPKPQDVRANRLDQ